MNIRMGPVSGSGLVKQVGFAGGPGEKSTLRIKFYDTTLDFFVSVRSDHLDRRFDKSHRFPWEPPCETGFVKLSRFSTYRKRLSSTEIVSWKILRC